MILNLKKTEFFHGFYYINKQGEPTVEMTDGVVWLEEIKRTAYFYKNTVKQAREYFDEKYPDLKKFIKFF